MAMANIGHRLIAGGRPNGSVALSVGKIETDLGCESLLAKGFRWVLGLG
jgi:hypothetical protein